MGRLSDTEALARQTINRPGAKIPPFGGNDSMERGADNAVAGGRNPGQFQRESNAGAEGLSGACKVLKEGC